MYKIYIYICIKYTYIYTYKIHIYLTPLNNTSLNWAVLFMCEFFAVSTNFLQSLCDMKLVESTGAEPCIPRNHILGGATTEDEMGGRHHRLSGRKSEQTPGVGDGQGSLACCTPWGCKELDTTEQLN